MTINREHFEAWLFSQPKERKFVYIEGRVDASTGCLMCNYLRENFHFIFRVYTSEFRDLTTDEETNFPKWLNELIWTSLQMFYRKHIIGPSFFTAGEVQTIYLSLFPETIINVSGDVVTNSLHGQRGVTQINYAPKS